MAAERQVYQKELAGVEAGLQAIGYCGDLLRPDYSYADFFAEEPVSRTVTLAAFSNEPPSYVNACFGVVTPEADRTGGVRQCRALGAPQIIVLDRGGVERWRVHPTQAPVLLDRIPTSAIRSTFARKRDEWSPDAVSRAKATVGDTGPRQVDFVDLGFLPALEHQAQEKLNRLIVDVVRDAQALPRRCGISGDFSPEGLFEVLFGLVRAKVLRDTGAVAGIDLTRPAEALRSVQSHYATAVGTAQIADSEMLEMVSQRVADTFLFQNLSVETLAYVYENTLVSKESRRARGIHSTPAYVADYILSRLPVGQIPMAERKVVDPTCGQGTFLVAALRRLRALLPPSMSAAERHQYFVSHLRGMELEPYSAEVAKLSLLLADLPNPNGWDIRAVDSFGSGVLEEGASWASILVANPPFEDFSPEKRDAYSAVVPAKGGEMLRRVLPALPDGALVGVVLPRTFTDGRSYGRVRQYLALHFAILEITALPDRVFPKSDAETVLLLARKLDAGTQPRGTVLFRQVRESERQAFATSYRDTRAATIPQSRLAKPSQGQWPGFWVPEQYALWDTLADCTQLGKHASIHRGVEYEVGLLSEKRDELIRREPFATGVPGLDSARDQLLPYSLGTSVYLESRPEFRRGGAWDLQWCDPKVVANAQVSSRGPWRINAAVDRSGLVCTQTFHALWPSEIGTEEVVPPEMIAAVVNGPVCNAYLYAHEGKVHNQKQTLVRVPFPPDWASVASEVVRLVAEYTAARSTERFRVATDVMLRIDALVLSAYSLPPREERRLLDLFWGHARHGVFEWNGYIPPEFTASIPLRMYLSESFRRSTAKHILEGAPSLADSEIKAFFDRIS